MNSPTISQQRRRRERQALAERIMDAARALFVRDGYEAVTMAKIAEAIEYSPGTIYQYFKDKRALVMAIIRADYIDLRDCLLACRGIANPVERLSRMAHAFAEWGTAHPNHLLLMTMQSPAWIESGRALREHENPPIEEDVFFLVGSIVADIFEAGIIRENHAEPGVAAATLVAAIHGLVMQEIALDAEDRKRLGVYGTSLERRVDTLIQVLMDGFLKPDWRVTLGEGGDATGVDPAP